MSSWHGKLAARVLVVLLIAGVVWLVHKKLHDSNARDRRVAQRVNLLDAPKPPPPKVEPKPVETKPEKEVDVRSEAVREAPGPKEPSNRLGLDAEGAGGGDAFGLEARRGGRDITTIGPERGGGGTGSQWTWYGGVIRRHLEEVSRSEKRLRGQAFQIVLQVWVTPDGRVAKFALLNSSGNEEIDRALRDVLASAPPLPEPPPQDMPQPIRLRVTSRVSG